MPAKVRFITQHANDADRIGQRRIDDVVPPVVMNSDRRVELRAFPGKLRKLSD
jgi:hypothetical protein